MSVRDRVEVMHGVNLNMLGSRDPEHYGPLTLAELETRVADFGHDLALEVTFFHTNSEEKFVERLHRLGGLVDGLVVNPGAWTHYAWSIRDALEITGLPTVEVHLSDVEHREPWRRVSVIRELCVATVSGQGLEGYRVALGRLKQEFAR